MFEEGNVVRIVKKTDGLYWMPPMDKRVGMTGVVDTAFTHTARVKTNHIQDIKLDIAYFYPNESIQLVRRFK